MKVTVQRGKAHPLGPNVTAKGVNFSVFSQHADSVELLLFTKPDDPEPFTTVPMNRTFHMWHAHIGGLKPGVGYAYRVSGPGDNGHGFRFNTNRVLIDPYARANDNQLWSRALACDSVNGDNMAARDNLDASMRSIVVDTNGFDWQGDQPLNRPMADSVIYEMHVRGFTQHPSAGVKHPGTFLGVVEKIPYLKSLGVTAIELLPVFEFDETDVLREHDGTQLRNYWGYSTMSFFAPHRAFATSPEASTRINEFRTMVKELHKAGIEVILDVVFNHTDEGQHQGPVFSFKGLDNSVYYHLVSGDRQYYMDYTGCGNTFNCNHPIGAKLIADSLRYWVEEMHVDGFRFDEGTILTRNMLGIPDSYAHVIWDIELSAVLAGTKLIAEAWDAGGDYEIGHFPGFRWAEWNGKFRDDVRAFVRGDEGRAAAVATRMLGSSDLYQWSRHSPANSINFVTCHDGFTLNDLVSYNEKHNEANGEGNRDGIDDNLSWNCGAEGVSDDPAVEALRRQQIRNFTAIQMLSLGVPMITGGDEMRRTQQGNNNGYCQDSELSWHDWSLVDAHTDTVAFFRDMIAFRMRHACLRRSDWPDGVPNKRGTPDVTWHGCQLNSPDWSASSRQIAYTLGGIGDEPDLHIMVNMFWGPANFELPPGRAWRRAIDTALDPGAISAAGQEPAIEGDSYLLSGRSVVVLIAE